MHDMKLAIVALDLGKDSQIMVNSAANSVIQVPTLLFQADLVPDGRTEEYLGLRSGDAGWYQTSSFPAVPVMIWLLFFFFLISSFCIRPCSAMTV